MIEDIDEKDILLKFPLQQPREGQIECISKILQAFKDGKKFVISEMPTGAGKSAIGITISRFFESAYYLTSQRILQSQIINDFGSDEIIDLKGRNSYPCNYWDNKQEWINDGKVLPMEDSRPYPKPNNSIGCDVGVCKTRDNVSLLTICENKCPYWIQVHKTQSAHLAVMNFKSFLFQTTFSKNFAKRSLIIIDESHRTEPELLDFITINIIDSKFSPLKWPKLETAKEYQDFMKNNNLLDVVEQKIKYALYANDTKESDEWSSIKYKIQLFLEADPDHWVSLCKEVKDGKARVLELKPIFLEDYAYKYLFNFADKILLMSATILSANEMKKMLSIKTEDCFSYRMRNRFPKENRPVLIQDIGHMSYNKKLETQPKLIKKINEICLRHEKHKGIIHTHNFEIANLLINGCDKNIRSRFLFQNDFNSKDDLLEKHASSTNTIIVAPAMHEGVDLKDDLSRFQIIAKIPFPSLNENPQLKMRMELSPSYYSWLTALKLIQSVGRSIRSDKDWAITYILDSDFKMFYAKAKEANMLPDWFIESVKFS